MKRSHIADPLEEQAIGAIFEQAIVAGWGVAILVVVLELWSSFMVVVCLLCGRTT
jgi:hypothetical protein